VRLAGSSGARATVGLSSGPEIAIMDSSGRILPPGRTGEVVLRGEQITSGYLKPPEANTSAFQDGWFRTGDEGTLSAQGELILIGRMKEMINSGGEKISPYEVEEALLAHPSVAQAVAFAAPHEMLGEQVMAAVVLHEGSVVPERELLKNAGTRLTRCKLPRRVLVVNEIPRGATGKLQRIGLANRLGLAAHAG
jgi:acyl-CoA synthetase (AMP-forming)/AMP-acid ligase II